MNKEQYQVLNTELTTDPLGRGYAQMTDEVAADDLNTEYREVNQPVSISDLEIAIRESLKWTQYQERAESQTTANVYDYPNMKEFMDLFFTTSTIGGGGAARVIDMQGDYMAGLIDRLEAEGSMGPVAAEELRRFGLQPASRAFELDLPPVRAGDVEYAREL